MIDVVRPAVAPASLAAGVKYNDADVLALLHAAFLGKCYLCETPIEIGTFEVDHRRPQGDPLFAHLAFAWDNLFPTCTLFKCNQRRARKYPAGGLLDPGQGVESKVEQRIEGALSGSLRNTGSVAMVFSPQDPSDLAARNTADELDRIHNATGSTAVPAASALRMKIQEHVLAVTDAVFLYVGNVTRQGADPREVSDHERRVRYFVSRRAPYAMLVRSYFQRLPAVRAHFD